jgi:hypothetical protein
MQMLGISGQCQPRLLDARTENPVVQSPHTGEQGQAKAVFGVIQQILYGKTYSVHRRSPDRDKDGDREKPPLFTVTHLYLFLFLYLSLYARCGSIRP